MVRWSQKFGPTPFVPIYNHLPPGHRRCLGQSQRALRTRVVTRRLGFPVGGSQLSSTEAGRKALANNLRAWLANPATLPNDAPRRRHTQVLARRASPSARAASQVLAATQHLHVSTFGRRSDQRHAVTSTVNTLEAETSERHAPAAVGTDGAEKL